jgi:hypothetical protein
LLKLETGAAPQSSSVYDLITTLVDLAYGKGLAGFLTTETVNFGEFSYYRTGYLSLTYAYQGLKRYPVIDEGVYVCSAYPACSSFA